jgi:hypothetical protein
MTLCEFCTLRVSENQCSKGHETPKKLRCKDFAPGIEKFCSKPSDYVGRDQLKQMATYFGLAGNELKLVIALGDAKK